MAKKTKTKAPLKKSASRVVTKKALKARSKKTKKALSSNEIRFSKRSYLWVRYFLMIIVSLGLIAASANVLSILRQKSELAFTKASSSSDSFLAYDEKQTALAKVVGGPKELVLEMEGFQSASPDLQEYVLKDYRKFKQNCVVNGQLLDDTSYVLKSVVYDSYALVGKYCNGVQNDVLVKMSGVWTIVYSNNDLMPCSLVNDYSIPKGISLRCADNGVTYLNPNP